MKNYTTNSLISQTLKIILTSGEVYELEKGDELLTSVDLITIVRSDGYLRMFPAIQVDMIIGSNE